MSSYKPRKLKDLAYWPDLEKRIREEFIAWKEWMNNLSPREKELYEEYKRRYQNSIKKES